MKIASVTFYSKMKNVGGGFTPAFAFKKWCNIFGLNCDLIGITDCLNEEHNQKIDILIANECESFLNNKYDCIFFSTPPIFYKFNMNLISKNFMIMLHGEYDKNLYIDFFNNFDFNKNNFKGMPHINYNEMNDMFWHPCCDPDYLISKDTQIQKRNEFGIVYAARICNWLNINLYLDICKHYRYNYLYGAANNIETMQAVANKLKNVNEYNIGTIKDIDFIKNTKANMFWDVIGNSKKRVSYNRLSLSAFEAIRNGFIPIVSEKSIPKEFKNIFIEINQYKDSVKDIICKIFSYKPNYDLIQNTIENSYASYDSIERRMLNIIEKLID